MPAAGQRASGLHRKGLRSEAESGVIAAGRPTCGAETKSFQPETPAERYATPRRTPEGREG
jgi:hypothetical protein